MARTALLLLAALTLAGCHVTYGNRHHVVNGVVLGERHEEVLEIDAWHEQGLHLDVPMGDVRVERGDGPTRVTLVLYERYAGDASASYEAGSIVVRTQSGQPYAIGDVRVVTAEVLPTLVVESGMGDVDVSGVEIAGILRVDCGMGDVHLRGLTVGGEVPLEVDMGDLVIADVRCGNLDADVGMGDIDARELHAGDSRLVSEMGDVDVRNCTLGAIEASTGMGDVDTRASTWKAGTLSSGMGTVTTEP